MGAEPSGIDGSVRGAAPPPKERLPHQRENGAPNVEPQSYGRSRRRVYPNWAAGLRRRIARPPCGSLLSTATNSVPLLVSRLNASSEMISDDRDDAVGAI